MPNKHEQELSLEEIETREAVILDTLSQHTAAFGDLHTNSKLNQLITYRSWERRRPVKTPSQLSAESREDFILRARMGLDVRGGNSARLDAEKQEFRPVSVQLLSELKEEYGQTKNVAPPESSYDVAIVPANRGENTKARFSALDSYRNDPEHPLSIKTAIIPASYRPTRLSPDEDGLSESERAGDVAYSLKQDENGNLVPSKIVETEYDYGVNIIQHKNHIPESEMTRMYSYDKRVPASRNFQKHSEIAYHTGDDGVLYVALSSPMVSENRYYDVPGKGKVRRTRPNTNDNMIMIDDMMWDAVDKDGNRPTILLVTESIYQFQRVIAESMFARKGIRVDSAFVNSETAGLPNYTDANYGQELLSLLIELNNSINELEDELENLRRKRGSVALSAAQLDLAA